MMTLHLSDGRKSEIKETQNAFESIREIKEQYPVTFLFTDTNVYKYYREEIEGLNLPKFVMEAGEAHKQPSTLLELLSAMTEAGMHRGDCLVALGGGVVGDIGGLSASLYMRGIRIVQVPTTVLSQVDSSVGGKTAVDFGEYKNLIGTFYQPNVVLLDGNFFKTLPDRELRCGLGEIVKHSALSYPLFEKLQKNRDRLFDLEFLSAVVPDNVAVKAGIVEKDEKESGKRKLLNLGHTTGHALELYDKKLSHGEYVLVGMLFESYVARRKTETDEKYLEVLSALVKSVLGEFKVPPVTAWAKYATMDKKNEVISEVCLVAPKEKGEAVEIKLPFEEYVSLLEEAEKNL